MALLNGTVLVISLRSATNLMGKIRKQRSRNGITYFLCQVYVTSKNWTSVYFTNIFVTPLVASEGRRSEDEATAQSLKEGTISLGSQRNSAQTRSRSVPANLSRIMSARIRCWSSEKNSLKQPTVPLTTSSSR